MNNKKIHVWITKYALTQGIIETDAILCLESVPDGSMIKLVPGPGEYPSMFHRSEWHTNYESAKMEAMEMRRKAIESAKRKIATLERLTF